MGTIADKTVYLDGTKDAIHDAIVAKGVTIDSGATFRSYATSIAAITTGCAVLPDLVAGGTYPKQDGTPVVITPISGETTAIRLLVAATGPMRTSLVLAFTGSPTIDWGDGTTTNPTSGTAAVHQYDGVNPIPCSRPYGVYYMTITGGTVTSIQTDTDINNVHSRAGNIVAFAAKSTTLTAVNNLFLRSNVYIHTMVEDVYVNAPIGTAAQFLQFSPHLRNLRLSTGNTAISFLNCFSTSVPYALNSLDLSAVKISTDFNAQVVFASCTSILFNPANTEIGNIDIRVNMLSTAAFVALFESLPNVTAKTIQIGGSIAALALTTEQLEIATNKGWTVSRTY